MYHIEEDKWLQKSWATRRLESIQYLNAIKDSYGDFHYRLACKCLQILTKYSKQYTVSLTKSAWWVCTPSIVIIEWRSNKYHETPCDGLSVKGPHLGELIGWVNEIYTPFADPQLFEKLNELVIDKTLEYSKFLERNSDADPLNRRPEDIKCYLRSEDI